MKKNFSIIIMVILLFITGFYSYVNASYGKNNNIKLISYLSKNIYLGSKDLDYNILVYKSNKDLSNYGLHSVCDIDYKYEGTTGGNYFFRIKYLDSKCMNPNVYLVNEGYILLNTRVKLNINNEFKLLNLYTNYNNYDLLKFIKAYTYKKNKLNLFSDISYKKKINYSYLRRNRVFNELDYKQKLISDILDKRKYAYKIPVDGKKISTKYNVIPNTGRPYRKKYTDGIHHGWDIFARKGYPVNAIDDSIVIRVVNDFKYSKLRKLKKNNVTDEDKLKNLDILRGNQVWLKTMKGDVIFYSHLTKVFKDIKVGEKVNKGKVLGTIGSTGVPDRNYKDFHLHFAIHKNPYLKNKKEDFIDIMRRDWYYKGKSRDYILKNQKILFEQ